MQFLATTKKYTRIRCRYHLLSYDSLRFFLCMCVCTVYHIDMDFSLDYGYNRWMQCLMRSVMDKMFNVFQHCCQFGSKNCVRSLDEKPTTAKITLKNEEWKKKKNNDKMKMKMKSDWNEFLFSNTIVSTMQRVQFSSQSIIKWMLYNIDMFSNGNYFIFFFISLSLLLFSLVGFGMWTVLCCFKYDFELRSSQRVYLPSVSCTMYTLDSIKHWNPITKIKNVVRLLMSY